MVMEHAHRSVMRSDAALDLTSDFWMHRHFRAMAEVYHSLLVQAEFLPGDRVLDLGCGSGTHFGWLVAVIGPEGRIVGVDPDPENLDLAQQRISRAAWREQVTLQQGPLHELPFEDNSFDAAMACITVHQWDDAEAGLREMRRVATGPVVVLTLDIPHHIAWQRDYLRPLFAAESARFPTPIEIASMIGPRAKLQSMHTPIDCQDGFIDAFWGRPEALLDPAVRSAQSAWGLVSEAEQNEMVERLRTDLESGAWDAEHGHLRSRADYDGAIRIVTDDPTAALSLPRRI